jgi:hypothetical protein
MPARIRRRSPWTVRAVLRAWLSQAPWLSKATSNPVVPFHAEAASYWSMRSWDQTQIPRPFTTVALVIGEPFVVPRDADDDLLEKYRLRLEHELRAAERRCLELLTPRAADGPGTQGHG